MSGGKGRSKKRNRALLRLMRRWRVWKQSVVITAARQLFHHLSSKAPLFSKLPLSLHITRPEFEPNVRRHCETMKNNSGIQSCHHPPLFFSPPSSPSLSAPLTSQAWISLYHLSQPRFCHSACFAQRKVWKVCVWMQLSIYASVLVSVTLHLHRCCVWGSSWRQMGFCGLLLETALNSSLKGDTQGWKASRKPRPGRAQWGRELGRERRRLPQKAILKALILGLFWLAQTTKRHTLCCWASEMEWWLKAISSVSLWCAAANCFLSLYFFCALCCSDDLAVVCESQLELHLRYFLVSHLGQLWQKERQSKHK